MAKAGTLGNLESLLWLCRAAWGSTSAFESRTVGVVLSRDPDFQPVSVWKCLDLNSEIGEFLL